MQNYILSRIFKAEHFVDDFENNTFTFSHPSSFEDMWELQINHLYFIQCWGINQDDSSWEIYDKDKTGLKVVIDPIAFDLNNWLCNICNINVNPSKNFKSMDINFFLPYKCYFVGVDYSKSDKEVEYLHQKIVDLDLNKNNKETILDFLHYKKPYYKYEREARMILDLDTKRTKLDIELKTAWNVSSHRNLRLLKIPFKSGWYSIIERIEINPLASQKYAEYIKERLMRAGLESEKIFYKGYNIQSPSIDFNLFLETYSKGKIQIVDKMLMAFFADFQGKGEFSQEVRNEYLQNIQALPEHIVFNMTFNYLNVWLNGGSNKNLALVNEVFAPIQNKLKENLEDTKNVILLLFLAIYWDDPKEFLPLLDYDRGLCKFGTLLQLKEEKQLLLEIWQKIWEIDDDHQRKDFCHSAMSKFYDRAYDNYHESKALNPCNPYFEY